MMGPDGLESPATPSGAAPPRDLRRELLIPLALGLPITSFFGKCPRPWPTHAIDSSAKFVSEPFCDDAATAVADPAPSETVSRSAETCSAAADREYAEHLARRSSASAPWRRESRPHLLPKARVPAWPASARTIARSQLLPCPPALASAARRKTSLPHRSHVPACVRSGRRFLCPPSQFAGSAYENLRL